MDLALRARPRRAAVLAIAVIVALLTALVVHARLSGRDGDEPAMDLSRTDDNPDTRMLATQFRVSTFNLLGAGHTVPGGDKPGYASGYTRMGWSVQLINNYGLDVIGFQEMRRVQFDRFMELEGRNFGIFTGDEYAEAAMANSIVWRLSEWRLIQKQVIKIPYFEGSLIRMPYVLLENRRTGQRAWFSNFHNPANPKRYGDQEKWRDQATELEIGLMNRLRKEYPTTPVFLLGDFNEREEFFCRVARRTGMYAANGGGITADGRCVTPDRMLVDWIMGTTDIGFTQYRALRTPLVQKTTDHPLVISDASIAPQSVQGSPIRRVVVVSVAGLRSGILDSLPSDQIPAFTRMMTRGAGTLNARTSLERTTGLPNEVGMVTGRRVAADQNGHGVTGDQDPGGTVHDLAGRYVSGAFDLAHNFGRSTALYASSPALGLVERSWSAAYGGPDPAGLDNGRDKIDTFVLGSSAGKTAEAAAAGLASRPRVLTWVQLNGPALTGVEKGFGSSDYAAAVRRADRQLGWILRAIDRNPATAGRTLVVLTSEHGGKGRSHDDPTVLANARVPFFVLGPNVEPGGRLYTLNPHYTSPGSRIPSYTDPQPVRSSFVANLALMALRLPSVPGSRFNYQQDLNVFTGQ